MDRSLSQVLACLTCGAEYPGTRDRLVCDCQMPLEVKYAPAHGWPGVLSDESGLGVWRYAGRLPGVPPTARVSLGEGATPLIPLAKLGERYQVRLLLKDEAQNPTGSFKARGASVAVSTLAWLGCTDIAIDSVGNAGAAWAAFCARAGLRLKVGLPTHPRVPDVAEFESRAYGAGVERSAHSLRTGAGRPLLPEPTFAGAFWEPYRLEGDKTIFYELVEQLGHVPDVIVWPTGSGVGLVGIAKAIGELTEADIVPAGTLVTIVCAQNSLDGPLSGAFDLGLRSVPDAQSAGVAPGVWSDHTFAGEYILDRVRGQGCAKGVTASDADIRETMRETAITEGVLLSPEGALSLAVIADLVEEGVAQPGQTVVCVNTASGLRYYEMWRSAFGLMSDHVGTV